MNLRPLTVSRRPLKWRFALLAALALALLSLGRGSGDAAAGLTDYSSTLYLSGATSALLPTGGYQLITAAGPGQPGTAAAAAAGGACSPCLLGGAYSYAYTRVDPAGGETAVSPTSNGVTISTTSKSITVSGLPTGVALRLYRQKGAAGLFTRVADVPSSNASPTYSDTMDDTTAAAQPVLPQAQNRVPTGAGGVGYQDFSPGVYAPSAGATAMDPGPLTTPNGKGWIIDGSGTVSFPAGTWSFTAKVRQNGTVGLLGTAHLVVGMWKVTVSGGAISSSTLLVDPTCSTAGAACGENTTQFITASGTSTITQSPTVSAFSLASGEHLYVQYWRRQTVAASTPTGTTATMYGYDGVTQITHPTANAFPNVPGLGSIAARVNATPPLSATFSDPDASDTGTLSFQLCSDNLCSSVLQTGSSSSGIANNASGSWMPTSLADGTYYWRASAQDSAGNPSGSSATRSFVVDTVAPTTPSLVSPAAAARVNSTQVSATFTDPGDNGTLSFELCGNASCSSLVSSSTSGTVSSGSTVSWTPTGVADGTYYWRARAQDAAGNQSDLGAWSAARSFTLDTTVPAVPTLGTVAALVNAIPHLSAAFSDPDSSDTGTLSFQVCSDSGCANVVQSSSAAVTNGATRTWTPTNLADGTYYVRTSAQDASGNQCAWSAVTTFALDATPPGAAIGAVAARTATTPQLSATYSDASNTGTLSMQLCTNSTCTSVSQSTSSSSGLASGASFNWTPSLADGTYYWRARAQDAAGNQSAWSSTSTFTLDRTAPSVPTPTAAAISRVRAAPMLSARLDDPNDPTDSARMLVELCSDAGCATIVKTGYSSTVQVGSIASWQSPSLPDGTYYWRALAEDIVGNQSAWSAPRGFVVDTLAPSVPETTAPADGALVNKGLLTGTFQSSDAGDGGTVEFQVCANAACTTVLARGVSASVSAGGRVSWTADLPDGSYFWRARATDEAGNSSDWSAPQRFTLDRTPPGMPRAFSAAAEGRTLTLRWRPPAGRVAVAGYALLINGRRIQTLDAKTLIVRIRLRERDRRSFAIAAVDEAGNVGAPNIAAFRPPAQPAVKLVRASAPPKAPAPRKPRRT